MPLVLHTVRGGLSHVVGAAQVHGQGTLEQVLRRVQERMEGTDTRIAHEDIDTAQLFGRFSDEQRRRAALGHVTFDLDYAPPERLHLRQCLIDTFTVAVPVECQVGALSRTFQCGSPADAA